MLSKSLCWMCTDEVNDSMSGRVDVLQYSTYYSEDSLSPPFSCFLVHVWNLHKLGEVPDFV